MIYILALAFSLGFFLAFWPYVGWEKASVGALCSSIGMLLTYLVWVWGDSV